MGLLVPRLLELDAAVCVGEALGPVVDADMGLGAVRIQLLQLVAEQWGGLPAGARQRHLDGVGVEVDGFAVVLLAEGGVAGVAHFFDHGSAVRVDRHRRRRDTIGDGRLLEGAVEVVEGFEFAGEEGVVGEVCDVFGGGVDGDGEEEEGIAGLDGLGSHGVIWGGVCMFMFMFVFAFVEVIWSLYERAGEWRLWWADVMRWRSGQRLRTPCAAPRWRCRYRCGGLPPISHVSNHPRTHLLPPPPLLPSSSQPPNLTFPSPNPSPSMASSDSQTLIRKADMELMPPPPPTKRIKRPPKVLDEDTYTDALVRSSPPHHLPQLPQLSQHPPPHSPRS